MIQCLSECVFNALTGSVFIIIILLLFIHEKYDKNGDKTRRGSRLTRKECGFDERVFQRSCIFKLLSPVGGNGAPYCSETRLSGKSRAVVFARGETMRGEEFRERMSQTFAAQVQGGPSTVAIKKITREKINLYFIGC